MGLLGESWSNRLRNRVQDLMKFIQSWGVAQQAEKAAVDAKITDDDALILVKTRFKDQALTQPCYKFLSYRSQS